MKKKVHSRAGLFLIELMISILFFAITASIFLQVFAKSETIRKDSKELFEAQMHVASVAEIIRDTPQYIDEVQDKFPQSQINKNQISIFYDENWRECGKKEYAYQIQVKSHEESELNHIEITAYSSDETVVYEILLKQFTEKKE